MVGRLIGVLVAVVGLSSTLAAQQVDTTVTLLSSDTTTVALDSLLVDSVAVTVTRVDTVGWTFVYQPTPGTMTITDIWRFIMQSVLGVPLPPDTTPAPLPLGDSDILLDLDDPNSLGLNCGGGPLGSIDSCPNWPTSYRKHSYLPTGGVNGTGAINMHWFTGMGIGFSPILVNDLDPNLYSRHFRVRYDVKQTAEMTHIGSAIKLHRFRVGKPYKLIGTLVSLQGNFGWFWETWDLTVTIRNLGVRVPTDSQWHTYEIEIDFRDTSNLKFSFWLDGALVSTLTTFAHAGDLMAGATTLQFSPFAEMYSCGPSGCGSSISTGDYTVDNFSYTVLP